MIGRTIGQYRIVDKIGEGGMGAVWRAEDTSLGRLVALKTMSLPLSGNEEARERFLREARAASSLNHPGITTVYELVEDEDTRLICMEYVEGKTIRDTVESGVVSVRKAIDIILQAAEALEAAHNKGILHRDIKSANIMITMEGRVKVMDFGLAHLEQGSELTRTGTTLGTLSYSSPEQLMGKTIDRRCEVWSLGVVFYELLTGQLPFKSPSEGELVFGIINTMPKKVTQLRDDVPELVEAVVERMLEKDPELRYQDLGEVTSDLKGIRREMETSTVSITGTLEQPKIRKRKSLITRIGIAVAVVAVAVVATLLLSGRPELDPTLVVVERFENRTGDAGLDYLSDIAAHRIISAIGQGEVIEAVQFDISSMLLERPEVQSSVRPHRSMALLTGAGTLVMGAFYLADEQTLEFQADIVDALSDRMLVPLEPLQGPRSAPLDLVRKVQERVSAALASLFDPFMADWQFSSPQNLDAYRAYIDGLQEINRSRWSSAVPHLQRAISADPTYAPAKISLATAYLNMGGLEALSAADSLVSIVELQRDRLPFWEAVNLKWLRATLDGDTEAAYRAALENFDRNENNSAYYFLGQEAMKVNRLEEAIEAFEGTRLDSPFMGEWVPYWRRLSDSYLMFGQPAKALNAAQRGLEMHPGNRVLRQRTVYALSSLGRFPEVKQMLEAEFPLPDWNSVWYHAACVLRGSGFSDEARSIGKAMVEWYEALPADEQSARIAMSTVANGHYIADNLEGAEHFCSILNQETPTSFLVTLGVLAARRGDREEAMGWSRRLEENGRQRGKFDRGSTQFSQALIAAQLGDLDRAMDLLREAYRRGRAYTAMYFYPELEPLKGHPQYEEFMRPKK